MREECRAEFPGKIRVLMTELRVTSSRFAGFDGAPIVFLVLVKDLIYRFVRNLAPLFVAALSPQEVSAELDRIGRRVLVEAIFSVLARIGSEEDLANLWP